MDEVYVFTLVIQSPLNRRAHQTLGTFDRDRLQADGCRVRKANLGIFFWKIFLEERFEFSVGFSAVGKLDAGVNIFGVLAENRHVDKLRMLDRRRHAVEVAYGPQANVEIEQLTQSDVERSHAAADRSGQRPLDADKKLGERRYGFFVQPAIVLLKRLLARIDFHPVDFLFALVGFFHGCIEHARRSAPNIAAGAVAFDIRNDWVVGNLNLFVGSHGDLCAARRDFYHFILCHVLLTCKNSLRAFYKSKTRLRLFA